jgi:outer membrane protein OmpA-like peptidoglycan-associated protein
MKVNLSFLLKPFMLCLILFTSVIFRLNAQETLFFQENFDNPTPLWYHSDIITEKISKEIKNGSLRINQKDGLVHYTYNSLQIDPNKNFRITSELKITSSLDGGGVHFLLIGENEKNYYFGINSANKSFWVGCEQKGIWETINDYSGSAHNQFHEAIKGIGETNFLELKKVDNDLAFLVNNVEVFRKPMSRFESIQNKINYNGFGTSAIGEVLVDNYKIYRNHELNLLIPTPIGLIREKLANTVNSDVSDLMPLIAPDGKTLYFIRGGNANNYVGTDNSDIYYSSANDKGEWQESICLGYPLNNTSPNAVISISPDNNTLFLMHQYSNDGKFKNSGFSVTQRTDKGWSVPKDVIAKNYYNEGGSNEFCFSADMQVLISAIKTKQTVGSNDLYVSFRNEDGTYTEPLNMGNVINSKGWEVSPFLASDNKTLYFSSDGHPGYGSNDVYMSRRLDDTWTNWSTPKNLGMDINTPFWDSYFSVPASGEYAYVVSNLGKSSDIYRIKLSPEFKPEPVVIISGRVLNAKTKEPLQAAINFSDINNISKSGIANSEPNNGYYKLALPSGKNYQFLAIKEGFYPNAENIDLSNLKSYTEIQRDLYLSPLEVGEIIRLNNLFFDFAKSDIKKESMSELERVISLLKNNPIMQIEIGGHTDNVGDDASNLILSTQRVQSVVNYILSKDVPASQITLKGYGEKRPISDNSSDIGRAKNRRVEFTILTL